MYNISIIGASDSKDTFERVNKYRLWWDEESKCRVLQINFDNGDFVSIYLGINDRVSIESV